jgi:hypothetical protein
MRVADVYDAAMEKLQGTEFSGRTINGVKTVVRNPSSRVLEIVFDEGALEGGGLGFDKHTFDFFRTLRTRAQAAGVTLKFVKIVAGQFVPMAF